MLKGIRRWAVSGPAVVGFAALIAWSEESDEINYKFQHYEDNNEVSVSTNTVSFSKRIKESWKVSGSYLVDAITGASRRDIRGTKFDTLKSRTDAVSGATRQAPDAVTSASPTSEKRNQVSAGATFVHDIIKLFRSDKNNDDPTTLSLTGITSEENDYTSRTISFSASQDLFQRNTTFGLRAGKSFDQYRPPPRFIPAAQLDPGWNFFGNGARRTDNASLSLTQGLSTTTIASIILGYVFDRGYLGRPYYVYKINDVYRHETVPVRKKSMTITGMCNQYIPLGSGLSVHLEYRYYADSWEIRSHTGAVEVHARIGEYFIVRPSLRLYTQSSAFFYRDVYDSSDYFLTTDLRYGGYATNTMGLKVSCETREFIKPENHRNLALYPVAIDVGVYYMTRTGPDDLSVLRSHYAYYNSVFRTSWIQAGVRFAF
jgi:hypothetical protein